MYSGAAFGRAPACTPYVNWAFVLTAGTSKSAVPTMSSVSATEPSTAVDHGRRNAVLLLWDEDGGEGAAAHRSGRDQVAVRLGGGQRRFGQRWIRMDPGGQQPRPVQRTLDGGGLGVIDPVGEPDQPPERGTRAPLPAGGAQVTGGRRVVLLRGDRVAFGAQAASRARISRRSVCRCARAVMATA